MRRNIRSITIIVLSVCVLAALNYGIYEKQKIIENGDVVLLELAPVDPRSLMQGDYMRLRYAIEQAAPVANLQAHQKRGYLVIRPDENNVAQFIRFYNAEGLDNGEQLLHFSRDHGLKIMPDTYFFQEGHAKHYENAKYGEFKFDDDGNYLLVGLADENRKSIAVR